MSTTRSKIDKERFFCDICEFPLKSSEDFMFNSEYDCCHDCYLVFAESRREDWKNNWRPEKKLIKNHIKQKKKLFMKRRETL
jgi:hypothetical protein